MMCRDELLLKLAIMGLVALDASPTHMATLLQCYRGVRVCLCFLLLCACDQATQR